MDLGKYPIQPSAPGGYHVEEDERKMFNFLEALSHPPSLIKFQESRCIAV
jgi:hypothetical protein